MEQGFKAESIPQIYGRLSAHEFMLEMLYSQFFAQMSEERASELASEIEKRMKRTWVAPSPDPSNRTFQLEVDSHVMVARFLEKALAQANDIRSHS